MLVDILALTIGEELAALVATAVNIGLGKLIHELRTETELAPATGSTEIGNILVGIRHTQRPHTKEVEEPQLTVCSALTGKAKIISLVRLSLSALKSLL